MDPRFNGIDVINMRAASIVLALLASVTGLPGAQETRHFGISAWLAQPVEILTADVGRACAPLPYHHVDANRPRSSACRVLRHIVLDSTAGVAWSYALYRHTSVYESSGTTIPDTIAELELVLFTASPRGSDRLTAIAHTRGDYRVIADISVELASHRAGVLLSATFCLNGTGGCWQEFLAFRDLQWRELADPYWLVAADLKRAGVWSEATRLAKPRIDVRTLQGASALYGPLDANCCPSHRAVFQLALSPQGFRLLTLSVVADSL